MIYKVSRIQLDNIPDNRELYSNIFKIEKYFIDSNNEKDIYIYREKSVTSNFALHIYTEIDKKHNRETVKYISQSQFDKYKSKSIYKHPIIQSKYIVDIGKLDKNIEELAIIVNENLNSYPLLQLKLSPENIKNSVKIPKIINNSIKKDCKAEIVTVEDDI